jgi:hypothetical protein
MDGPGGYFVKWNKLGIKRQALHILFSYVEAKKSYKELIKLE